MAERSAVNGDVERSNRSETATGCNSVRPECAVWGREAAGSNPATLTLLLYRHGVLNRKAVTDDAGSNPVRSAMEVKRTRDPHLTVDQTLRLGRFESYYFHFASVA
jgi:hypothetical protein